MIGTERETTVQRLERERIARRRVADLTGFYMHLLVYVLVCFGLFVLDAVQDGSWWFQWMAAPWGAGVIVHGATVYLGGTRLAAWEERRLEQYVEAAADREMEPTGNDPRQNQVPFF